MSSDKTTRQQKAQVPTSNSPVVRVPSRGIAKNTELQLYVHAGGRCEFDGCNAYLLSHHLTHAEGNFAQMAHIVAFKPDGPRGKEAPRPANINDVENLMLLCHRCHKLIDDHPEDYTRATLEQYKSAHEARIFRLTDIKPDRKTTVVQLKARIGGHIVSIPAPDVNEAVSPRYPTDTRGYVIDLTNIHGDGDAFYEAAMQTIKHEVERLYAPGMEIEQTRHISLFALAPMPLLIYLGSQLSNKVAVDPYQRHRDTEDWAWKTDGDPVGYTFNFLREGTDRSKVALLLSLSGKIHLDNLPRDIDGAFNIYEITLGGSTPNPIYLRLKQDLTDFRDVYQQALRKIMHDHVALGEIHLLPAVPAPVAVLCGRELLPKVDPALLVYDSDKKNNGFQPILRVN